MQKLCLKTMWFNLFLTLLKNNPLLLKFVIAGSLLFNLKHRVTTSIY